MIKVEREKVQKIIDEMFISLTKLGANDITINFKNTEKSFIFHIVTTCHEKNADKIYKLNKYLCVERHEEMENYYWELAGNYPDDIELTLIGMMTDDVKISFDDDVLDITLVRNKNY